MTEIWKFSLPVLSVTCQKMPKGARILTLQLQAGVPTIWCEVEPSAPTIDRWFDVVGTGHPYTGLQYVGTFQDPPFVWHLMEKVSEAEIAKARRLVGRSKREIAEEEANV